METKKFYYSPEVKITLFRQPVITGPSAAEESPADWDEEEDD